VGVAHKIVGVTDFGGLSMKIVGATGLGGLSEPQFWAVCVTGHSFGRFVTLEWAWHIAVCGSKRVRVGSRIHRFGRFVGGSSFGRFMGVPTVLRGLWALQWAWHIRITNFCGRHRFGRVLGVAHC